ncbi:DUF1801 domain-containing protein [Pasteurella skyensis]|uniref:DUF1801 domain-containing protein n=1 Tax=Phocoenobacter skyensis TaxID=97481 RepID=A0AAJ6NEY4_9PAST|nr:DUF1801 domain-containing protein [Pasteurella skyensis]MDP8171354.1 DUF1801 domain-containing protein [Pasteurella skyensis]MDP8175573.1 DUF1801 domain-containing protein [Pasteurella skyensis]
MMKSQNDQVQTFLNDILSIDNEKYLILNQIREIVFENHQTTDERIIYGGIMFSINNKDFGGLFVRKQHISFEFVEGFLMEDPNKLLEGTGKYRRHLKIRTIDDLQNKNVEYFIKQAVRY